MSIFSPQVLEFLNAQQQAQDRAVIDQAAISPIPGLTGPVGSGAQIPGLLGMAPPQTQIPTAQPQPFQSQGPFGQQAMQMAGLLGRSQIPRQLPTVNAQGGLLGGPPKGFRIPGYPYGK